MFLATGRKLLPVMCIAVVRNKEYKMALSSVKVLGTGCAKCDKLAANATEALKALGISDIQVEHVKDLKEIARHGVMLTPAIVINGKAKAPGKVLSVEDITKLINEVTGNCCEGATIKGSKNGCCR